MATPLEYPRPLSGETREDVKLLWDALWRLTEHLKIYEEEQQKQEGKA